MSWVDVGRRVGRAEIERWNRHEHTVTREIAQVETRGGDLCRHVGSLVLNLCDQLGADELKEWGSELESEAVSDRYQLKGI